VSRRQRRAPAGDPLVAVAYLRVSTEDQRLGPEAQRAAIEAWATREGVRVAAWHHDHGVSGGDELADRPALVAALGELRAAGAGHLVVAKRDRLARDIGIACAIERAVLQCGAVITSADGAGNGNTPTDAFMRAILDASAAYERELIRARTKAALAAKAAKGERVGKVPYGSRLAEDGVHLEPEPAEQAVIARACAMQAEGRSLRRITEQLAAEGICGRTGRPLALTQVDRMLNPRERKS